MISLTKSPAETIPSGAVIERFAWLRGEWEPAIYVRMSATGNHIVAPLDGSSETVALPREVRPFR